MNNADDLEPEFYSRMAEMAQRLRADAFNLLGVFMSESSVRHDAANPHGGASGIFQAMPQTLAGLGFIGTPDGFRALTATQQLDWAEKYYMPAAGKLNSRAACYLWTFLPADIGLAKAPGAVLVAKAGAPLCPDGRRSTLFDVNSSFDKNGDSAIQVSELDGAIQRACRGPRWVDIRDRMREELGLQPMVTNQSETQDPDVRSLRGIQRLLTLLGFSPGKVDGLMGPATAVAVKAFQGSHGIGVDGIVGPRTRSALVSAWSARV